MTAPLTLALPSDFEEMLKALCVAARIERPLELHDEALRTALHYRGFIKVFGNGYLGTALLDETMKLSGAVQMIGLLLQQPVAAPPQPKPSFAPIESPSSPSPSPTPVAPAKHRIELAPLEREILRHAQVLSVAVESMQRELDNLLRVLMPHFDEIEDPAQMLEFSRTLPPGALRKHLEEKAARS